MKYFVLVQIRAAVFSIVQNILAQYPEAGLNVNHLTDEITKDMGSLIGNQVEQQVESQLKLRLDQTHTNTEPRVTVVGQEKSILETEQIAIAQEQEGIEDDQITIASIDNPQAGTELEQRVTNMKEDQAQIQITEIFKEKSHIEAEHGDTKEESDRTTTEMAVDPRPQQSHVGPPMVP